MPAAINSTVSLAFFAMKEVCCVMYAWPPVSTWELGPIMVARLPSIS